MAMTRKGRWIHPKATELDMPLGVVGPFVELSDGSLLIVEPTGALTSSDDGKTWSDPTPITSALKSSMLEGGMLIRTSNGVIILMFVDCSTFSFGWDDATGKPADNVKGDVWSIRSLDEGKTWTDLQMVMQGYCGAIITIIQTSTGEVVAPVQRLLYDPGRHATSTYVSGDDGASWSNSNTIDLGGHGHHDGAFEATLAELKDGRLMMLIRTTLDRFWEAYSEDKGRSWLEFRPSDIEASNTPAYLARLSSGRLALVWNRLYPEGETMAVRRSGPATQAAASNHRDELSIAFSEDEGQSWSEPVVFARNPRHPGVMTLPDGREMFMGGISYPKIFERRPGEMWITTGFQGHLRISMQESDFAPVT